MTFLYIDTYSIPTPSQAKKKEMKIEVKIVIISFLSEYILLWIGTTFYQKSLP